MSSKHQVTGSGGEAGAHGDTPVLLRGQPFLHLCLGSQRGLAVGRTQAAVSPVQGICRSPLCWLSITSPETSSRVPCVPPRSVLLSRENSTMGRQPGRGRASQRRMGDAANISESGQDKGPLGKVRTVPLSSGLGSQPCQWSPGAGGGVGQSARGQCPYPARGPWAASSPPSRPLAPNPCTARPRWQGLRSASRSR